MTQPRKLNEAELIRKADEVADAKELRGVIPIPDSRLPDGFENPPCGHQAHRCVDLNNIYRPKWFQVKLHRGESMPDRLTFNGAGRQYSVKVGVWCDLPPEIVEVLSMCVVSELRAESENLPDAAQVTNQAAALAQAVEVIDERPRFSYTVLPSA